jgi:Protein of unknown function (DUF3987)
MSQISRAATDTIIDNALAKQRGAAVTLLNGRAPEWGKPKPLPNGLLPVDFLDIEVLPESLKAWVGDIADRLQCPPDYVAVTALTALGSLIGRRIGIKPQSKTDWIEVPNLWGMFIGRPGMLKSPAMGEALKPLHHLETEAAKDYEVARRAYEADIDAYRLKKSVKASMDKEALRGADKSIKVKSLDLGDEPQEPLPVRYRTNDSTYEAVGELLVANPTGLLIERDELISLLKYLDREEQAVARGFYLTGWSGSQSYTFDRIGRGQRHIDAVCIGVLGNTQPSRISEYVRRANSDGAGGDGLIQRFGLMVWPDPPGEWRNVDRYPDSAARESAWQVFARMAELDLNTALKIGGHKGQVDKVPFLRFDEEAATEFLGWREDLEARLRSGDISPALEGHIAKYRKLVPALALVDHLADKFNGPVGIESLLKALALSKYLESHARRVYSASSTVEIGAAKAIAAHIQKGDLVDGFTARDVHQHDWSGLTDRNHVQLGLDLLADLDHLAAKTASGTDWGGRPKVVYTINPMSRP